jgi:hypothetical protein
MTYANANNPDTSHVSNKDIISMRLKHNRWTGKRYETDQWFEARFNSDTGSYDMYRCEAKWLHSKSTRRDGNPYQGQKSECVLPDLSKGEAQKIIDGMNYNARQHAREYKADRNPDGTKVWQAFYPAKQNFMRIITGQIRRPDTNGNLVVISPQKNSEPALLLPR